MEVANQGKSVGILSAAPSSAGLNMGGSGNPDFLIAADTTNNQLESMAQIHGATDSMSQGILTLSTQGLDSEGNVARGTINLIADDLNLNGGSFVPKVWVFYEKPASQDNSYSPTSGKWYNNTGILAHCEGPNHEGLFSFSSDKTYIRLYKGTWKVTYALTGKANGRVLCGIFDEYGNEIVSGAAICRSDQAATAICEYARNVPDHYDIHIKANLSTSGNILISRRNSYINLTYMGPYFPSI